MNSLRVLALLLTTASLAHAGPPEAHLVIDCAAPVRPTQVAMARLAGIDNFTSAYAARNNVMRVAHVACMRGATTVNVVVERNGAASAPRNLVASDASVH
jgi:hypothetical protein